jgi:flagellar biogenesis protein FliO
MKIFHVVILALILPLCAQAKVKLKDFEFYPDKKYGEVKIYFSGNMTGEPAFSVKKNMLQLEITGAQVWPRVEKMVSLGDSGINTKMMLYQFDKNTTRFRVLFPFPTEKLGNNYKVLKKKRYISFRFPIKKAAKPAVSAGVDSKKLDEEYLKKLLTEAGPKPVKDEIKTTLSALERAGKEFSLLPYVGKFGAFLGVVLLLFFGVVAVFKKGMIKKGKLGFLNKMKPVEVLSTTYLGPKKSLLLVKAHNQILLLGSSETGINFLSEVEGSVDLMKQGEAHVVGKNFDSTLLKEEGTEKEFKLKEDDENSLDKLLSDGKKEDKMSDQIKKKIQNLKSFQQVNDV